MVGRPHRAPTVENENEPPPLKMAARLDGEELVVTWPLHGGVAPEFFRLARCAACVYNMEYSDFWRLFGNVFEALEDCGLLNTSASADRLPETHFKNVLTASAFTTRLPCNQYTSVLCCFGDPVTQQVFADIAPVLA